MSAAGKLCGSYRAGTPARRSSGFRSRCRTPGSRLGRIRSLQGHLRRARRGAVLEDPYVAEIGLHNIEDLAPHGLRLGDAAGEPRPCKPQMLRPQPDSHTARLAVERKYDVTGPHGAVLSLAVDQVDGRRANKARDEKALRPQIEVVRRTHLL